MTTTEAEIDQLRTIETDERAAEPEDFADEADLNGFERRGPTAQPGKHDAQMTARWGIHDPAAVERFDAEKQRAFNKAFRQLDARLKIFTSLWLKSLDQLSLQRQVDEIGRARREAQLK